MVQSQKLKIKKKNKGERDLSCSSHDTQMRNQLYLLSIRNHKAGQMHTPKGFRYQITGRQDRERRRRTRQAPHSHQCSAECRFATRSPERQGPGEPWPHRWEKQASETEPAEAWGAYEGSGYTSPPDPL